ncbi:NEL-type E3 ubiquitin ligase domain-containing protein [Bradyrhizobium sp. CIAT3101]|uniref:NEL-type E3 ubiquitin ligase domain-containing protein n=1 Tax=Bradyrhizobium sp. CIAT3101 TaxID=439387 RepID=UPI0024B09C47|nr:NEL-type E3 ubiquitin ligase domain-containing protein [Bradyrhizobium sp. CIAT3101]WFU85648.1 NEL-type E3 ubiquitin ligase domain-containing protein [Bradyrhizobium sp. CIAT3101]
MNTGRAESSAGTPSEQSHRQGCLCGLTQAAAEWVQALTGARESARSQESQDQILDAWAGDVNQGLNENRQEAVRRVRAWRHNANASTPLPLNLSSLSLTTLPALPVQVQQLDASGNQLTHLPAALPPALWDLNADENRLTNLPETLPAGLQQLSVTGNLLTALPDTLPPRLLRLYASVNLLTHLPNTLPAGLLRLYVANNHLTRLPDALPAGLRQLRVEGNGLTSLPETLLTQLGSACRIELAGNPLSEGGRTNLAATLNAPGYSGPRVFFSMNEGTASGPARPLTEVAANRMEGEPEAIAALQKFAKEPGAREYMRFLNRLRETVSYKHLEFRNTVLDDLRQAAIRPGLRQQYFQLAFGASETCEDRITLTWNGMQIARMNADVEEGAYDHRLGDLVHRARVMFRLGALERIARQKAGSLQFVDEVEVYLAYQVKLRERLDLRLMAPKMRFFDVSYVTEHDLTTAEKQVRNEEAADFADYLATRWQPWETVVRRIAPEAHAQMQDRLIEAMDEDFQNRLKQRLADHDLTGNSDAELQFGAKIRDEIACEIKGELMRQVLRDHGVEL